MSSLIFNPSNSGSGSVTLNIFGDDTEYNINLPKTNGTLVSSVNGKGADSNGNVAVTIPSIASNADAIAGTNNTKIMTPLRTKEAINKYGFAYKKLSSINSVAGSFWFDSNSGINDSELPPNVLGSDWVGIQFGADNGNEKQQIIFNATHRWYRYTDDNLGSETWSDWTSSIHLVATSAEAQAGTVTDKLMTPALVKSAVAKFNSASATKLQTKRNIDGVQFDGTANIHHFATCSTAAGTTEKVVPMSGFVLATGARIVVKFTVTNTVSAPTMNVNGTGAKPIKYHGGSFSAFYLGANKVHEFVYDGANWCFVGDLDTRYTHPNSGVTAGTYNTVTVNAQGHVTAGKNVNIQAFPSGTQLLFYQANAPTGWTKVTGIGNRAVKIVEDATGGTLAGSVNFSDVFKSVTTSSVTVSGTVGAKNITIAQMAAHGHTGSYYNNSGQSTDNPKERPARDGGRGSTLSLPIEGENATHTHSFTGSSHSHTVNLSVKYINVIVCRKD